MDAELPEHVAENRRSWNEDAPNWVAAGERAWAAEDPTWGIWGIPESELDMLPDDMTGMRAIELGCGTAYVSAWMARRGATVTGIDISEEQLGTAARLDAAHGLELELILGNAESVPKPDGSYDFAISEFGAALWCEPAAWVAEAHRLLVPGGTLAMLTVHPLVVVASPLDGATPIVDRLLRPYFDIYRQDWRDAVEDPGGIDFNLPLSGWFRLFDETGFDVIDLREPRCPRDGEEVSFYATAEWAHRWPSELVWKARKR